MPPTVTAAPPRPLPIGAPAPELDAETPDAPAPLTVAEAAELRRTTAAALEAVRFHVARGDRLRARAQTAERRLAVLERRPPAVWALDPEGEPE
uniref:hypothetical protein n=1 Tax=uncultured Micrococcus sp. TaxID=114051 RepID=UPI0026080F2E|nr:hypothetical protein [uncultured Micrococcus sp.]